MLAINKEDIEACQILLSSGPRLEVNFFHKKMIHSYLARACYRNRADIVRLLVSAGADVDFIQMPTPASYPLWLALMNSNLEIFRILLLAGANLLNKYKTSKGGTLLYGAMYHEKMAIVECLLKWDPSQANSSCCSNDNQCCPATVAAFLGNLELLKLIQKHGGDILDPSFTFTPLHAAAFMGRKDIVQYILEMGVNPNQILLYAQSISVLDSFIWGWQSPLSMACSRGNIDCALTLIEVGDASPQINHNLCLKCPVFLRRVNDDPILMHEMLLRGVPLTTECICHDNSTRLVDLAISVGFYKLATLLIVHGSLPDWRGEAMPLAISHFPDNMIAALIMVGVSKSCYTGCSTLVKSTLRREMRSRSKQFLSLESLCVQAVRFQLQRKLGSNVASGSVWPVIDDSLQIPACLKEMLKLDVYITFT